MTRKILAALALAALPAAAAPLAPDMPPAIVQAAFGRLPDGTRIDEFTLTNSHGMVCKLMTYGAALLELDVPDRSGKLGDVVLGCKTLKEYLAPVPYFGATIGRVGNRIAKGRFTLDGKTYALATNNGPNSLHGGNVGFDKVVWTAKPTATPDGPLIQFHYLSKDGEEGYPGNLDVTVTYLLSNQNHLEISYTATTDQPTPVNLTNHTYWNLAGKGDILGHILTLKADKYTPVDDTLIPTGVIAKVSGTPMDFRHPKPIGQDIAQLTNHPRGYDHNWVIERSAKGLSLGARVYEPTTGRVMEVYTDQPGIQFYSGNFLDGTITGKYGDVYKQYAAFCLETQHFPDSPNHPKFPSIILRPGGTYRTTTIYRFSIKR